MKRIFTLSALAMAAMTSFAQWNTGTKPVAIIDCPADKDYYACSPMAARTADGKTWISYKMWEENGVHTYVQLLDRNGVKQFDGLGIKVNDYQTPTWWSEYRLAVAGDGSALVSVADSRSEEIEEGEGVRGYEFQPAVYKIGQDGSFLWGLDGITFPKYVNAPYTEIFVNGDDVYIQFTQTKPSPETEEGTYMNRINPDGTVAFEECKPFYGQMIPSAGSDMLVFGASGEGATVNKVNRDLEPVWDAPIVYDSHSYGGYEIRPYQIAPDGKGGAAVTFVRAMGDFAHNIRLQYIGADGELGFGLTGIDTYNAEEYDHDYPDIAINTATEEIMVNWEDEMALYTQSVGKYTYSGERMWGEKGIQLLSKQSPSGYAYGRLGSGALSNGDWILAVRDVTGWANERIKILRLNKDGGIVWEKNFGRGIEVSDPTIFVEEDATYIIFRNASSLDVLRVFNADGTTDGIDNTQAPENSKPAAYYTPDGKKLNAPQNGINIVKMSDGSVRKVMMKQ